MINSALLSLVQTPPLMVPLRFFLTAPLFGLLFALLLLFASGNPIDLRWDPVTLAMVHALVLGYLSMIMLGAVQQLLPVLLGAQVVQAERVATYLHFIYTLGVVALLIGFAQQSRAALQLALLLLSVAVILFALFTWWSILRSPSRNATAMAFLFSTLSLMITLIMAWITLLRYQFIVPSASVLTDIHLGWGLLGWGMLLIIGVAYQVVPMFQVTAEYPRWFRRWLLPLLLLELLLFTVSKMTSLPILQYSLFSLLLQLLPAALTALFAGITLTLQQRRKRRLADVSLRFWRVAMISLLIASVGWIVVELSLQGGLSEAQGAWWQVRLFLLLLFGVFFSVVSGMLFKIVPFLIWLHLNNSCQQHGAYQGDTPVMGRYIPAYAMQWQYRLQLLALMVLLLAALLLPQLLPLAALLWGGVFVLQEGLMLQALKHYRDFINVLRTTDHGQKTVQG
ncbi:MAG: hypothetical protein HQL48_10255 [Gammaproteobacteria bacterium]|nr:hypothetical protein [Gammaproteobacteria bacterium]